MANYDMGLVSTVPSDGSFISYIGFVLHIYMGKLLHGTWVKEFLLFFLFDRILDRTLEALTKSRVAFRVGLG